MNKGKYYLIFLLVSITSIQLTTAQVKIKGHVIDVMKNKAVKKATITEITSGIHTKTDKKGFYELVIPDSIQISAIEATAQKYTSQTVPFDYSDTAGLDFYLMKEKHELETVVVNTGKKRYRNKDNPAVQLIKNVVKNKHENIAKKDSLAIYEEYEKLSLSATNLPKFITKNFLFKPFSFIFKNIDSSSFKGYKLVPVFLEEKWSTNYQRNTPKAYKKIITAKKEVVLNPELLNEEAATAKIKNLYTDLDVNDDQIELVTNNFMSPLNPLSHQFYRFYIMDTTKDESGKRIIHLDFEPRNNVDMLLMGSLKIGLDDNLAVWEAILETSKHVNLNFVKKIRLHLKYKKNKNNRFYRYYSKNFAQFLLMEELNMKQGMVGVKTSRIDHYRVPKQIANDRFTLPQEEEQVDTTITESEYAAKRPIALSNFEHKTYSNFDSMRNMPYFKSLVLGSYIFANGYIPIGKFEIGPLYRSVSLNPIEGIRFRGGLRTNPGYIKKLYSDAYVAYGLKDKRLKYYWKNRVSLSGRPIFEFPMRYIDLTLQRDNKIPGRVLETKVQDNIFENIQRNRITSLLDVTSFNLTFLQEFKNNVQLSTSLVYLKQRPIGSLYFIKNTNDTIKSITSNVATIKLRWAPGEKYITKRTFRRTIKSNAPVITLKGEVGLKGVFNGEIDYQKAELNISKRFALGPLGFLSSNLNGNIIWGTAPYHILNVPRANQGYLFKFNAFNMMNHSEFVSDRQIQLMLNYRMMGFIVNKIPLINRLGVREVAGFRMSYGSLSQKNNPTYNTNQLKFPRNRNNELIVHQYGNEPYMEWNVGLENIFKVLRVDYVRRVNYLNHQRADKHGVRFQILFNF